jgi:hypothetical protein
MIEKQQLVQLCWGFAILVGGCAVLPVAEPEWPNQAPQQAYFVHAYDEDPKNKSMQTRDEYLNWVRQFYLGSDLSPFGWLDLQHALLQTTEAPLRAKVADKVRRLGQKIAAEWAKDNRLRRITSTMLFLWSQIIQEAAETGSHLAAIDRIEADVVALVDGRLPAKAIDAERYAPWTPDIPELI